MAVDLIVSPLSKYWSGDYITPVMEYAWSIGVPYNVVTPSGTRTVLEGAVYGGEGAKSKREELVTFVETIMDTLPIEGAPGAWSERSDYFGFYRVNPVVFGELTKSADKQFTKKAGLFGRFTGNNGTVSHLGGAMTFLPIHFDSPFDLHGRVFASLPRAKRELDDGDWKGIMDEGLKPIIDAFDDAIGRNLPLVVDL